MLAGFPGHCRLLTSIHIQPHFLISWQCQYCLFHPHGIEGIFKGFQLPSQKGAFDHGSNVTIIVSTALLQNNLSLARALI